MNKKYVFVLGIALLTSSVVGYFFQQKKYYLHSPSRKIEVTEQQYDRGKLSSINYSVEKNIDYSIILLSLISAMGIGLMFTQLKTQIPLNQLSVGIVELNKSSVEYYMNGHEKYKLGDYYGAISDLTKAIEINPVYAEAYHLRGLSKYILGPEGNNIKDLKKAKELGRSSSPGILDAWAKKILYESRHQ